MSSLLVVSSFFGVEGLTFYVDFMYRLGVFALMMILLSWKIEAIIEKKKARRKEKIMALCIELLDFGTWTDRLTLKEKIEEALEGNQIKDDEYGGALSTLLQQEKLESRCGCFLDKHTRNPETGRLDVRMMYRRKSLVRNAIQKYRERRSPFKV